MSIEKENKSTPRNKVLVIGGGPAGLMAAGQAALQGARVILLEKKHIPARKLGITGKGRCNLTNTGETLGFPQAFGDKYKFMRFSLGRFGNQDLISFFQQLGRELVTERGGRVFPVTQKAGTVVRSLLDWTKECGVEIKPRSPVKEIRVENNRIRGVAVRNKSGEGDVSSPDIQYIEGDKVILATGGASYPATGSTGDGYILARELGHTIVPVYPALVPLETRESTAREMQGLSLRNVEAQIFVQGKKQASAFGEMLFTHFGVSGPIILSLSKIAVWALNRNQKVNLVIDLKPAVSHSQLKSRISRVMHEEGKKKIANILKDILPLKMISVFLGHAGIDPDKKGNAVTREEQQSLRMWCKELTMEISGYRSFEEAIVTTGGVKLSEVNPKTMESRKVKGLYLAGEVLDIDADTGGYNLQAAFSTGWVAGNSAAQPGFTDAPA